MIAKLLLIVSSLLLSILIFLISHEDLWLTNFYFIFIEKIQYFSNQCNSYFYENFFSVCLYILIFLTCLIIGRLSIYLGKTGANDTISTRSLKLIEPANEYFLPIYLSYILVAISISSVKAFFIIFTLIAILLFYSRTAFFNPVLLVLGYRFYHITNDKGLKILLIIKYDVKNNDDFVNQDDTNSIEVKKINEYTYIQF
ncbi:MAG: hypothetical protein ACN6NI_04860 [Acinetobacter sp.]